MVHNAPSSKRKMDPEAALDPRFHHSRSSRRKAHKQFRNSKYQNPNPYWRAVSKAKRTFPFMSLPGNIRNRIYELVLCDPTGLKVTHKDFRVVRLSTLSRRGYKRLSTRKHGGRSHPKPLIQRGPRRYELVPSLLRLNKAISHEALSMFYGQPIIFTNASVLYSFAATVGPSNMKALRNITIKQDTEPLDDTLILRALALLGGSINLRKLEVEYFHESSNLCGLVKAAYNESPLFDFFVRACLEKKGVVSAPFLLDALPCFSTASGGGLDPAKATDKEASREASEAQLRNLLRR